MALQDGSASWNASAADALAIWNQYLDTVQFVEAASTIPAAGDGENSVFFSDAAYGDPWPPGVLAITVNNSVAGSGVFTETDVIFNNKLKWDSYRGPLQGSDISAAWDFHRVALHEFGHVLGLAHPDQNGQSVSAIMNSIISDLDHLADDDIAGAGEIYHGKVTSSLEAPRVASGANFSYQITANNHPSGYSATGLPPGFQVDPSTGRITGKCATSGTFSVDVTAQGARGVATASVEIVIVPLPLYGLLHVEVPVGNRFSYQIEADNNATSYDAASLPTGVQINRDTGEISGVPQVQAGFQIRVGSPLSPKPPAT